jgi:hypothetical protein
VHKTIFRQRLQLRLRPKLFRRFHCCAHARKIPSTGQADNLVSTL